MMVISNDINTLRIEAEQLSKLCANTEAQLDRSVGKLKIDSNDHSLRRLFLEINGLQHFVRKLLDLLGTTPQIVLDDLGPHLNTLFEDTRDAFERFNVTFKRDESQLDGVSGLLARMRKASISSGGSGANGGNAADFTEFGRKVAMCKASLAVATKALATMVHGFLDQTDEPPPYDHNSAGPTAIDEKSKIEVDQEVESSTHPLDIKEKSKDRGTDGDAIPTKSAKWVPPPPTYATTALHGAGSSNSKPGNTSLPLGLRKAHKGPKANPADTMFINACRTSRTQLTELERLHTSINDINAQLPTGETALTNAISQTNIIWVRWLLAHGASPEISGPYGLSALWSAVDRGSIEIVTCLLDAGADPNLDEESHYRCSIVANACLREDPSILDLLLARGAFVNRDMLLQDAASSQRIWALQRLLDAGADPNVESTRWPYTALNEALRIGDIDAADLLIKHGADVRKVTQDKTPTEVAVQYGVAASVRFLLEQGVNPREKRARSGSKPIVRAAQLGFTDVVELLFDANIEADEGDYDNCGDTDSSDGLYDWSFSAVEKVKERRQKKEGVSASDAIKTEAEKPGASRDDSSTNDAKGSNNTAKKDDDDDQEQKPHLRDMTPASGSNYWRRSTTSKQGPTHKGKGNYLRTRRRRNDALVHAAAAGHTSTVLALLSRGVNVNVVDKAKYPPRSALHAAIDSSRDVVMSVLLEAGANINEEGLLEAAVLSGNKTSVELLVKHGVDVTGLEGKKATAAAVKRQRLEMIRLLVKLGVDVAADGGKLLELCRKWRFWDVFELLKENGATEAKECDKPAQNVNVVEKKADVHFDGEVQAWDWAG
jgi:ankyrin repeat protein